MRSGGLILIARYFAGWMVRSAGSLAASAGKHVASVCFKLADRVDPPTCIARPPEWEPRLWDRTGGRTANESRD